MKHLFISQIKKRALFFVMSMALCIFNAKASHFAAIDLYVTYVGAGVDGCTGTTEYKYEVTLELYKACEPNNADLPPTATVNVSSVNAGFTNSINLTAPAIDTLDGLCDAFKSQNSCRVPGNGTLPGFVKHTFKATYTLPSAQTDWVFSWVSGARNANIQNLLNPSSRDIYVEAGLNNVIRYNNSTPHFLVSPLPYICNNQPANYLNGPYDVNGDSLSVTSIQPMLAANTPIPYNTIATGAGYDFSLNDPIASASSNPYKVSTATGTATFTPTAAGYFVLAYKCEEYDRKTGQRTGYITRDAQVSVLNCNAPPPTIDSTPLLVNNASLLDKSVLVCPGSNLNFNVNAQSSSTTSQVYMEANTDVITGSSFSVNGAGTDKVTGTFDWTPAASDIGEHTLIVTSKDSSCSGQGFAIVIKSYTTILIRVVTGLDAGKDLPICQINPTPQQLYVKGADYLKTIKWSDISGGPAVGLNDANIVNPIATPANTAMYVVSTPDLKGTCKSADTVSVYIDNSNKVDVFPKANYVMCRPGYLQLDAIISGRPPVSNISCGVAATPNNGSVDSINIFGSPVYGFNFSYDTLGASTPVLYNDVRSTKFQFLITKEELRSYGLFSSTLKSLAFETAKSTTSDTFKYSNFSIGVKCTNKKSLSKSSGFETGFVPVYNAQGVTVFPNGWHKFAFDAAYNWDTTQNLMIEICYNNNPDVVAGCTPVSGTPPLITFMPTTYTSSLFLKAPDANTKSVCGAATGALIENAARPVFRFDYSDAPSLPYHYKWYPAPLVSDSTIKSPLTFVSKSTNYTMETFGNNGCYMRDTLKVYVPQHNFSVVPDDTSACFGQSVLFEVKNGSYYQWFEYVDGKYLSANNSLSCEYCANPVAKSLKSTHYKIMVGDDVFCYDTIDAYIEVRPLPKVNILTPDTVVRYGQSVQLLVSGAKLYNWTPVSSLNNPNVSYPIATPTEPTMYVVAGISNTGCYSYDTVRVGISYRDNLDIPTAFSPNGDGKNDVFRVGNMSFRKFVEFKVFNRWGQEVYNGLDAKSGWDGTWKGIPQEMGSYQYMMKIGSPDGAIETYKGDVTLIR